MLVLKLKNGKDSGKVSKRDDFKLAARSVVVLGHQKVGKTLYSEVEKRKTNTGR